MTDRARAVSLPVADAPVPVRPASEQPLYTATRPFHVMSKPIGPICNLDCKYCFYLEKESLYKGERKWAMPEPLLEGYIRQYIHSQPGHGEINFAWQGGEPTLLGVGYFRRILELQQKHADGRPIVNMLQTNGTLLDDEWCAFLAENRFLVGVSVDGPKDLHDAYRLDKQQQGTFDRVVRGIGLLKKHGAEFNTLTVVNRLNSQEPLKVYRFLREMGSGFIQFIPLVERTATDDAPFKHQGLWLQGPPDVDAGERYFAPVTDWSVRARDYGRFLCEIFDEWVRRDVGKTFVQMFDVALGNWLHKGKGGGLCVFSETCGSAMAIEHNGDVYSCDHYVYPRYKLGNIADIPLGLMVESPFQKKFGADKRDTLPAFCRECEVRFACHGECPKHRFIKTPAGEEGLNYLCQAYKLFFNHVDPHMRAMTAMLQQRRPPAMIMDLVGEQEAVGGPLARRFRAEKPKGKQKSRRK